MIATAVARVLSGIYGISLFTQITAALPASSSADQDPVFKEVFYRELLPELRARGKAGLVISHDDRYFHLADRLVRLENGQVIAVESLSGS